MDSSRYKSENCEAELSGNLFEGKFTLKKKTHKKVKIRLPYWAEEVIINGEKAVLSESVYCELKSDFNEINIKFSPKSFIRRRLTITVPAGWLCLTDRSFIVWKKPTTARVSRGLK